MEFGDFCRAKAVSGINPPLNTINAKVVANSRRNGEFLTLPMKKFKIVWCISKS
jgi:hypothetical protein